MLIYLIVISDDEKTHFIVMNAVLRSLLVFVLIIKNNYCMSHVAKNITVHIKHRSIKQSHRTAHVAALLLCLSVKGNY